MHVTVDDKGYSIDQVIDGETVAEVLDYVQYNPKKLVRTLETWVTKSVKEGRISVEEGKNSSLIIVLGCTDILIWNNNMKEKLTIIKVGGKIVEEESTLNQLLADFLL